MTKRNKMSRVTYLFCFILLLACEKENEDNPKVYHFDSFETGEVRIFTNDGEINDAQLSASFINRWSDYFYNKDSFQFDDFAFNGEITLGTNNQSIIHGSDTTMTYRFQLKSGVIYFESIDTAYSNNDLINMKDKRLLYGPITQTDVKEGIRTGFPPMPSYHFGYLPCVYAVDKGEVIKIPFLSFLEKNCYADNKENLLGNCNNVTAFSNLNNMLNIYYVNRITNKYQICPDFESKDTIVIQENFIVFRKL